MNKRNLGLSSSTVPSFLLGHPSKRFHKHSQAHPWEREEHRSAHSSCRAGKHYLTLSDLHECTSTLPDWKPSEGRAELWLLLWPVLAGCVNQSHTNSRIVCRARCPSPQHVDVPSWVSWPAVGWAFSSRAFTWPRRRIRRGQRESRNAISSLCASGRCRDELREE